MARTGRPKIDNPKSNKLSFRLDSKTVEALDKYCNKFGVTRSEAVRLGIESLSENPQKNRGRGGDGRSMPSFLL